MDSDKFFGVMEGIVTINGHGNRIVVMVGFTHVKTRIYAEAEQKQNRPK